MSTFNYSNLRINFNLQSNGKCLNNKTLEPESCEANNSINKYKFEKVTLGNNQYVLVDYSSQNCLQKDNTMNNFNIGQCKVFNKINSRYSLNGHNIKNPSFNGTVYSCKNTIDIVASYVPSKEKDTKPITIPTLPKGYVLPFKGNTLYNK